MSIQLDPYETLIRLSEVPKVMESLTGEAVSVSTVHRWRTRGLRGVRLQTCMIGGYRRTCRRWLDEFFEAVSQADEVTAPITAKSQSSLARRRRAEEELREAGI